MTAGLSTAPDLVRPVRDAEPAPVRGPARWVRVFVAVGVALGLLLLGAAGGLLLGLPGSTAPGRAGRRLGGRRLRAGHDRAPPAGGADGLLGARPHHRPRRCSSSPPTSRPPRPSQIGRMQGWLELWGAAALPVGGHMAWMTDPAAITTGTTPRSPPAAGSPRCPGWPAPRSSTALRAATGPQLDVLFLQLMLRHHEGGAGMLSYAAEHASVPQVRNLAAPDAAARRPPRATTCASCSPSAAGAAAAAAARAAAPAEPAGVGALGLSSVPPP